MSSKQGWFDKPGNLKKFLIGFYAILAILVAADFFVPKHGSFAWENYPLFYAAWGFAAYVGLIFTAKFIRLILKRPEDYYDH